MSEESTDDPWPDWVKTETILRTDTRGMRELYQRWQLHRRIDQIEAKLDRLLALLEEKNG